MCQWNSSKVDTYRHKKLFLRAECVCLLVILRQNLIDEAHPIDFKSDRSKVRDGIFHHRVMLNLTDWLIAIIAAFKRQKKKRSES